jgi:tetratricopeptide (TPR) repeat protein
MANVFEQQRRNVIPGFRNYADTLELRELDDARADRRIVAEPDLSGLVLDWEAAPSVGVAADLLSCALVAGIRDIGPVKDAARFIFDHDLEASGLQLELARRFMGLAFQSPKVVPLVRLTSFIEAASRSHLNQLIRQLRRALLRFERNPVIYTELARLFAILGRKDKAGRCMSIAVGLAGDNRYVLRSAARLWASNGEPDRARELLLRSSATTEDPWLISAEIALATLTKRSPRLAKRGSIVVTSGRFAPFSLAELSCGLGTLELLDGNRRRSRELFRAALRAPNDNALAQVEWALSVERLFDVDLDKFDVKRDFEAVALEAVAKSNWLRAIEYAEKWFLDMPFAKRPVMLGSHLASTILENGADTAITFCRAGLVSHPRDPQLLNNLAYALALKGKSEEAAREIEGISLDSLGNATQICLTATKGLIAFRRGNAVEGRALYLAAIDLATRMKLTAYGQIAFLNYAREEITSGSSFAGTVADKVLRLEPHPGVPGLAVLADRVRRLSEKTRDYPKP